VRSHRAIATEALRWRERDVADSRRDAGALAEGGFDAVFFASSDDASAELAHHACKRGRRRDRQQSTFRLAAGVPLVVPEVNPHAIRTIDIFPVANCTAIVLCVGIAPIARARGAAQRARRDVSGGQRRGQSRARSARGRRTRGVHARAAERAASPFARRSFVT
jgi:aspartate-semialdehyde dehydrogenase